MSNFTEKERAQWERAAKEFAGYLKDCEDCATVPNIAGAFNWAWQAARRAQMVPHGWKLVPVEPTEEMLAATSWPGCAKTDYQHMLRSAPQPPEESPVQLPKPAANSEGGMVVWNRRLGIPPIDSALYTEQQVLELISTLRK